MVDQLPVYELLHGSPIALQAHPARRQPEEHHQAYHAVAVEYRARHRRRDPA